MKAFVSQGPQQGPAPSVRVRLEGAEGPLPYIPECLLGWDDPQLRGLPEEVVKAANDLSVQDQAIGISTPPAGDELLVAMAPWNPRDPEGDIRLVIEALLAAGVEAEPEPVAA